MPDRAPRKVDPFGDDKSPNGDSQADLAKYPDFRDRLQLAAKKVGLTSAKIAAKVGVTRGTFARYWNGERLPPSDQVIDIADELLVSVRWLMRGDEANIRGQIVPADAADWIDIDEYDLRELTDEMRGPVVSTTPFRRDWLNRTFGQSKGLWLARLPADLPARDLRDGDLVFLRDVQPGEAPQDGGIYIVRVAGFLTVARVDGLQDVVMASVESNIADRRLSFRNIGFDEDKAALVARVLGAPLRRL